MPRILILMSDTGGGHRAAANALSQAIQRLDHEHRFTVDTVDFITETAFPPFHHFGKLYRPSIDHAAWFYGLAFKVTSPLPVKSALNAVVASIAGPKMLQMLRRHPFDLIVSVHPLATSVPGRLLRQLRPNLPFVTVVTDLATAHPFWFWRGATRTFVASDEAQRRAVAAGVPAERVERSGLPIDLRFLSLPTDKAQMKREYGLPIDRPMVLLVGGGEGMGGLDKLAGAIADSGLPLSQMVIAGRNERLRRKLTERQWKIPTVVTGFVRDMPRRMAAADLLITKAGPGTLAEGLATRLPIFITSFIPGQEEGNVRWITESGVGRLTPSPDEVSIALRGLFNEHGPTILHQRACDAAATLAAPRAALDIAARLIEMADLPPATTNFDSSREKRGRWRVWGNRRKQIDRPP
ncbi:MAG: hypothetical protein KDD73_01320 [Anaerolineales bacterium]|nr:hypothetical protein [Anaerolineales bacterium]MCB9126646.1 hypothetical protein [Ardenticatenales bacterium]MCB9172728.1 hypothetical protein [Ardenticatenales bacterium]